jgi:cell division protein FtsW (lipid II flippase)
MVFLNPWEDRQGGGYQAVQAFSPWGMAGCWVLAWGRASKSCFTCQKPIPISFLR